MTGMEPRTVKMEVISIDARFPKRILLILFKQRYWEGRKLWSEMTLHLRTLTRCIWIGVKEREGHHIIEKKSAINLLIAFVFATKHYLREEYAHDFEDLQPLINHLRRFSTPTSNTSLKSQRKVKVHCKYMAHDYITPSNIPLELVYYISGYVNAVNEMSMAEPYIVSSMEIGK